MSTVNSNGSAIKHLSLDLWMTLIRSHPAYKRKRAELFCRFFSVADLDAAEKAIRKIDLMANHINETTGGNIDAVELYLLVLHEVHNDWKSISPSDLRSFYKETERLFEEFTPLPADESVTEGLQMAQDGGITMNILSNTGFIKGYMLQKGLDQLGWSRYFSFSLFSDETGHSKPHPSMFDAVWTGVTKLNDGNGAIAKTEILHFGDNPFADVEGAARYGFASALFTPEQPDFCSQLKNAINRNGGR
ncbi:MAG: HAD family hydrolase [Bacteroidota bacterium]